MKKVIVSFLLAALCIAVFCQEASDSIKTMPMVEFTTEEKVVYVNELGLAPSASLFDALRILPELISNDVTAITSLFEVQVDNVPVGDAQISVLLHTHIIEVEKVEITTNPSTAQSSSGVTGVINIIMKPARDGLAANTSLDVSTSIAVLPSVNISYHKNGLSIFSSLYLQYYDYDTKNSDLTSTTQTHYNYKGEVAKLHLKYDFNPKQQLTFWLMQGFENQTEKSETTILQPINDSLYEKGIQNTCNPVKHSDINIFLKYEHVTDRPGEKMLASLSYSNNYHDNTSEVTNEGTLYKNLQTWAYSNQYITRPNHIDGAFYYRFHLLPDSIDHKLRMKPGININTTIGRGTSNTVYSQKGQDYFSHDAYEDFTRDISFAPYLQFYYEWGPIATIVNMRYQLYAFVSRGEDTRWQTNIFNDFLGDIVITYSPAKNHQLKASANKSLNMPSNLQLFSNPYYTNFDHTWHKGDSTLTPEYYPNVRLQYIYHLITSKHEVQFSTDIAYIRVVNPISSVRKTSEKMHVEYDTYQNSPDNHIINGNVAIFWRYKIFSLIFATNLYDMIPVGSDKHKVFCNMQVTPVLRFEHDWTLSGQFQFVVPINGYYLRASLQKQVNSWIIRLCYDNLTGNALTAGFTYVF